MKRREQQHVKALRVKHRFGDYTIQAVPASRLDVLCRELKQEFPNLVIRHKRDVLLHHIVAVLIWVFNREYLRCFTTTGPNQITLSDKHHRRLQNGDSTELDRLWETLTHERIHLRQFRNWGVAVTALLWLFPPILLCYGRAVMIEKPGYIQSLRAKFEVNPDFARHPQYKAWWVKQFTGPNYGYMLVLRSKVEGWFDTELRRLEVMAAGKGG